MDRNHVPSICRFERNASSDAIESIKQAVCSLAVEKGVGVSKVSPSEGTIEENPADYQEFKYFMQLQCCSQRLSENEDLIVLQVFSGSELMGFGIASKKNRGYEIEIIDVKDCFKRSSGSTWKKTVSIGSESFEVGVGHIVALKLLENLDGPISVDAAIPSSQYIFASIGFKSDDANPCCMRLKCEE